MIAYVTEWGKLVEQSPTVWFGAEFISTAQQFTTEPTVALWAVDWSRAACAVTRQLHRACVGTCAKDVRIIRQEVNCSTVIWCLTGEYDYERDMYLGVWKD